MVFSSQSIRRGSKEVTRRLSVTSLGNVNKKPIRSELDIDEEPEEDDGILSTFLYSRLLATHRSVHKARKDYVKLHMEAREWEFSTLKRFHVFVGTWNVNGQPPCESLKPWLQPPPEPLLNRMNNTPHHPPDIYAIGFQELDLSVEAFLFNDSHRDEKWLNHIETTLPVGCYHRIEVVRLVGLMLVVYVHEKHKEHVNNVASGMYGTGVFGIVGNKGGVAIRFQFYRNTMCFVNSHLAAHVVEVERRNKDFNEIYNNLMFTQLRPPVTISSHEIVFWLGDLNYRFDDLLVEEIKHLSAIKDFKTLYKYDQLNRQRQSGKTLNDFRESQPSFTPTYKYNTGTNEWDTSSKMRPPAWCDRVLWKGEAVKQLTYASHCKIKSSDHKPVSSTFHVRLKIVDEAKEERVMEGIFQQLDKEENWSVPKVRLSIQELHFGCVDFMESRALCLHISNIGNGTVEFVFISKSNKKEVSAPWFRVSPESGSITMDGSVQVVVSLCVDKCSVPLVTERKFQLNDILVLHLIHGKDIFIPLNAEYTPSVFGSSLETLVRMRDPIKEMPVKLLHPFESITPNEGESLYLAEPQNVPKELWLLVDHLFKYGMRVDNILLQAGIYDEIVHIVRYLDTKSNPIVLPGNIYSIGSTLVLFLESMYEPVIPYRFHDRFMEVSHNPTLCKRVLYIVPRTHFNVFRYICAFLRELLKYKQHNKHSLSTLASTFGGILMRSKFIKGGTQNHCRKRVEGEKKAKFVSHFLVENFRW